MLNFAVKLKYVLHYLSFLIIAFLRYKHRLTLINIEEKIFGKHHSISNIRFKIRGSMLKI